MLCFGKIKLSVISYLDNITDNVVLVAIRRGLIMMTPFMIMGAFAIFVNNLPIPAYQQAMLSFFGESWKVFGAYIFQGTFSIISIGINIAVSYSLVTEMKSRNNINIIDVSPIIGAMTSLSCLFVLFNVTNNAIRLEMLGAFGIFISMITALISTSVYVYMHRFKGLNIKLYSNTAGFTQLMKAFFPAIITLLLFVLFRMILVAGGIDSIHTSKYDLLQHWFKGFSSEFSTGIVFVLLNQVLWFFGVHGGNALDSVGQSVFVPQMAQNQILVENGLAPAFIFTKDFFDVFVFMGGTGTTLALIIAVLLGIKRGGNIRQVAKLSLLPGLINVNEMVMFAIPVIFNFYLLIPFIFIPLILTLISYFAISIGLVPYTVASVEWTTPIIMGGYITTGNSVSGSILQIFNLSIAILCYLPFLRMYGKSFERDNKRTLYRLLDKVLKQSEQKSSMILQDQDTEGNMARNLVHDLKNDLKAGKLYMEFQPQINADNTIFGTEALVRWNHDQLGLIPPPVIIAIAEESSLMDELGNWIFAASISQYNTFKEAGFEDIIVSVNITPSQLDNTLLADDFIAICNSLNIPPKCIEIEITEQAALGGANRIKIINKLKEHGFHIAMDDFGMGHSSLMYLKEFNLSTIKLDGSLVKEILVNPSCCEIISSIVHLCKSMDIHIIAEFVETKEQRDLLEKLGCCCYQGYLYSKAVSPGDAISYFKSLSGS